MAGAAVGSAATAIMHAQAALHSEPLVAANPQRRVPQRDDRPRRSVSYRHTEHLEVATDPKSGLEYEVRACKYCDTAFSFKGGTTSAALRHLRLAHPLQVYGIHGGPTRGTTPPLAPASVTGVGATALQQHPQQQEGEDETRAELQHEETETEEGAVFEQEEEDGQQEHETTLDEPPPQQENLEGHEPLDGNRPNQAEQPATSTTPAAARVQYHKRRRYEDELHGVQHHLPMAVNQVAIAHFIAHYKHVLPPAKRFAFVKHLAYNDREAAMYNVLDEEMRLEFLTQFNEENGRST